ERDRPLRDRRPRRADLQPRRLAGPLSPARAAGAGVQLAARTARPARRDAAALRPAPAGARPALEPARHPAARQLTTKGTTMAIGPVQLLVLGFNHPEFHGEIIAELERLRASDTVRVIDALAVYKDADGELEVEHLSNISKDEAIELGTVIGALVGLGI